MPFIVQVAINTGMRQGEILKLRLSDIDHKQKLITVRAETEKSGRSREIPISDKLLDQLSYWIGWKYEGGATGSDRVFPFVEIKKAWTTMRKRADLEHVEFHTLRHHFGSMLVLRGVALSTVMRLMGHTNLKTTQRYLSVRKEDMFKGTSKNPSHSGIIASSASAGLH